MAGAPLNIAPNLMAQPALPTAAEIAKRAQIQQAAQDFEASFLTIMFQQMFSGVETEAPFGGGSGETMFRSFLTDAFAKQTVKSGGVGIADVVTREMLKLQGMEA